jgi:DNA-directed RNA polymerase subunit RPC12/RpoP
MKPNRSKQLSNGAEKNEGIVRSEMYCHDCSKQFIAIIDYSIDGNHIIICPHCGHQHCRLINDGVVTETRWDSMSSSITDRTERIWTDTSLKMKTSSTSHFLRDKWLNFGR